MNSFIYSSIYYYFFPFPLKYVSLKKTQVFFSLPRARAYVHHFFYLFYFTVLFSILFDFFYFFSSCIYAFIFLSLPFFLPFLCFSSSLRAGFGFNSPLTLYVFTASLFPSQEGEWMQLGKKDMLLTP